jgi:hypothetical protein
MARWPLGKTTVGKRDIDMKASLSISFGLLLAQSGSAQAVA